MKGVIIIKKHYFVLSILVLIIIFSFGVSASPLIKDIVGKENRGITVTYNHEIQTLVDGNNNIVYPVIINGSTYLPVSAVSKMMDCEITWNSQTQTVAISSKEDETASSVPTDLKDTMDTQTPMPNTTEIELGLSKEDVFNLFGNPAIIQERDPKVWYYGGSYNSSITFDKDWKVKGWTNKPTFTRDDNVISEKLYLGMNKDEVVDIFGAPTQIQSSNQKVWYYGNAYSNHTITFNTDWEVVGWDKITKELEK